MAGMLHSLNPVFLKRSLRHVQLIIVLHILLICCSGRPSFCFRQLSQDYVFLKHEVPLLSIIVSCWSLIIRFCLTSSKTKKKQRIRELN